MYENFYSDYLYPLQDKVLQEIDKAGTSFYFTGGTATSRCYLNHRYSDDLDLFQNRSATFCEDAERVLELLQRISILRPGTKDESFYRVFVKENPGEAELKVEFINDIAYHKGTFISHPIYSRVDSWMNILSNKVTALSREAAKDIADILFISFRFAFRWKEVIEDARKKDAWINEIVASRILYDFDPALLGQVQWKDERNKGFDFSGHLKVIARSYFTAQRIR